MNRTYTKYSNVRTRIGLATPDNWLIYDGDPFCQLRPTQFPNCTNPEDSEIQEWVASDMILFCAEIITLISSRYANDSEEHQTFNKLHHTVRISELIVDDKTNTWRITFSGLYCFEIDSGLRNEIKVNFNPNSKYERHMLFDELPNDNDETNILYAVLYDVIADLMPEIHTIIERYKIIDTVSKRDDYLTKLTDLLGVDFNEDIELNRLVLSLRSLTEIMLNEDK